MTTPVRLRLSRRKGFVLQDLSRATNGLPARKADRASGFGNPYTIKSVIVRGGGAPDTKVWIIHTPAGGFWRRTSKEDAHRCATEAFRAWLARPPQATLRDRIKIAFRDHNPACWCKEDLACHTDVLIEIART